MALDSKQLEDGLFAYMAGITSDQPIDLPETLTVDDVQLIQSHFKSLTVPIELSAYEASISSAAMPAWISPLHFERNLNNAIDALEAVEAILGEIRALGLTRINLNFIAAQLNVAQTTDSDQSDPQDLPAEAPQSHRDLSDSLQLDAYEQNIRVRLIKRAFDLVEYTKAAKLGAQLLFQIEPEATDPVDSFQGVNRIRESLRSLLEEYRSISNRDRESTFAISLKHAKDAVGKYLVTKWAEAQTEDRKANLGLTEGTLEFDLSQYPPLAGLQNLRCVRIGVQIVDKVSCFAPTVGAESQQHNYWQATLSDSSGGIKLGKVRLQSGLSSSQSCFETLKRAIQQQELCGAKTMA